MMEHALERYALGLFWAALRYSLAPDLSNPLAKDRAMRADAALARLVAGYAQLPALRGTYQNQYAALLAQARSLADASGLGAVQPLAAAGTGADSPLFVGVPGVAGDLEALLVAVNDAGVHRSGSEDRVDALLRDVARVEAQCRGDYEERVLGMQPRLGAQAREHRNDQELNAESLQRYLRHHPRGTADLRVRKVTEIPGGRSKRTALVELEPGSALPAELVLRLDNDRGVGTSVIGEFPLLERVSRLGLPVPEPLWLEASSEPFSQPFIVFRRSPGAAAGGLIEGAFRKEPRTARALAQALARVHAAGAALIEDPAERASAVSHTRELLAYYLNHWRSKKPFPSLVIEAAFIWMFRRLDQGLGEATVVHADTGFHNLLLDEGGKACLLDWEFAHFGDPAEDLASCRPAVEKCMPWPEFMAEYQAHGGKPVSDFRLNFWEIWRPLRNAVVCGTTLHSLLNGEANDIDPVTIGCSTFQRLQADLARSLDALVTR